MDRVWQTILLLACWPFIVASKIIDVPDYWPEISGDLTRVKWSHATNSRHKLQTALSDGTMMIEADVSYGYVLPGIKLMPVMVHPPLFWSDLSFEDFMKTTLKALSDDPSLRKGIKLDFKSSQVIEECLEMAKNLLNGTNVNLPLWINADIVHGPNLTPNLKIVNADEFLTLADKYLPDATASPGFTTGIVSNPPAYTDSQVQNMIDVLAKNGYLGQVGKRITFPIRAIYAANSIGPIRKLLQESGLLSTLTLWGSDPMDEAEIDRLNLFIESIGKNRTYTDLSIRDVRQNRRNLSIFSLFADAVSNLIVAGTA